MTTMLVARRDRGYSLRALQVDNLFAEEVGEVEELGCPGCGIMAGTPDPGNRVTSLSGEHPPVPIIENWCIYCHLVRC